MSKPTTDEVENARKTTSTTAKSAGNGYKPGPAKNPALGIAIAALVVAAVGVAIGGYAVLSSSDTSTDATGTSTAPTAPTFDDAQRAEAKTKVCSAFQIVRSGVSASTNAVAPGGPEDLSGTLAVAANARLALLGGGQYLLDRVDPATPQELADQARNFGNLLMDIGATTIEGVQNSDPVQAERLKNADAISVTLTGQCAP